MKERVRLVSGEFSIDSKPGQGTTILARVPLAGDKSNGGQLRKRRLFRSDGGEQSQYPMPN